MNKKTGVRLTRNKNLSNELCDAVIIYPEVHPDAELKKDETEFKLYLIDTHKGIIAEWIEKKDPYWQKNEQKMLQYKDTRHYRKAYMINTHTP